MASSVTRALITIQRYDAAPDQLDQAILAAINVTLCLAANGDDWVSEGFNLDIAMNGGLSGAMATRPLPPSRPRDRV
jgi:hypothetical protein